LAREGGVGGTRRERCLLFRAGRVRERLILGHGLDACKARGVSV
jgi:hypothetical protein